MISIGPPVRANRLYQPIDVYARFGEYIIQSSNKFGLRYTKRILIVTINLKKLRPYHESHGNEGFASLPKNTLCGKLNLFRWQAMVTKDKKLILCIEDEEEMIDLIRLILTRRGFDVRGANGGKEGLEIIRTEHPDLILLDLMMPDMDGWEVYQQMKADDETKDIPVIVVTAKAQSIDKVLGLHIAKVDDYIAKPFSPQELLNSVDNVLGKQKEA